MMVDKNNTATEQFLHWLSLARVQNSLSDVDGCIGASVRIKRKTFRIPDYVIGPISAVSNSMFSFDWTCRDFNPPLLVIEITSTNRSTDITERVFDYVKARIAICWVNDRLEFVFWCHHLYGTAYKLVKKYSKTESVTNKFFRLTNLSLLLAPSITSQAELKDGINANKFAATFCSECG